MARNINLNSNIAKNANLLRKQENRADSIVDDTLLQALLNNTVINKQLALNIPSLSAGISFIADMVAMTPLKLYREIDNKVEEVKDDYRLKLFNDETGDTLSSFQMWRALIYDMFLGKGGFAYLNKQNGKLKSVHYIDEANIFLQNNTDPIFKDYNIYVQGKKYYPFDFIKLLRNTKNGSRGVSILEESPYLLSVCWNLLKLEETNAKKGGVKDGFLESEEELTQEAVDAMQEAWARQFSNTETATAMVLNKGVKFNDASSSLVELQLNENKITNASEVAKILHISQAILCGNGSEQDYRNSINTGVLPVLTAIESAMNRDVLREIEKSTYYWAFETTEITKADIKTRYEAYSMGLKDGYLQLDEVRYKENLTPLGFNYIKLNLGDIFLDPITKQIYTPNTGQTAIMDNLNKNDSNNIDNQNIDKGVSE